MHGTVHPLLLIASAPVQRGQGAHPANKAAVVLLFLSKLHACVLFSAVA